MSTSLPEISVSELGVSVTPAQPHRLGEGTSLPRQRESVQSDRGGGTVSDGRSVAEVPSMRRGRNLVICLDGTLNTVGENVSLQCCSSIPLLVTG